jgi:3-phosphoshikimate 1-carboxyvinyltransferase
VPGDKSISHRIALLAALAQGTSRVRGFLDSEDCLHTLDAMACMGAGVRRDGTSVEIDGTHGVLRSPPHDLDMGNSGTGMRLLTGLLAGFRVKARLFGDASLSSRPMRRILEPLDRMGAKIHAEGPDGRAPLVVHGSTLDAIDYVLPVASAQVKSCLLLAGLGARGTTRITEPLPSRDHTERMFRAMGLPLAVDGPVVSLVGTGGAALAIPARDWSVPGDISSAAFWLVAAAVRPGARVTVRNLGLNPSRTAFLDALRNMGANIEIGPVRDVDWEPQADVTVVGGQLHGTEIRGAAIPNLIDEIPVLCVAAACAQGATRFRDAAELRVKESDRIETTAAMLRAAGVDVATCGDGLDVQGGAAIRGSDVDSHGDHRIAMSAAVLALSASSPTTIRDTACVATSYPAFAEHLLALAPGALAATP